MPCQRERDTHVQTVHFSVSLRAKRSNPLALRGLLRFARNDTEGVSYGAPCGPAAAAVEHGAAGMRAFFEKRRPVSGRQESGGPECTP